MSEKHILISGDQVFFDTTFEEATVTDLKTGKLEGTANCLLDDKKLCLEEDETKVKVEGCPYTKGTFVGGIGTLKIEKFEKGTEHVAKKFTVGDKSVLFKGNKFKAIFEVTKQAQMETPKGPELDTKKIYKGTGWFETQNKKWTAE